MENGFKGDPIDAAALNQVGTQMILFHALDACLA